MFRFGGGGNKRRDAQEESENADESDTNAAAGAAGAAVGDTAAEPPSSSPPSSPSRRGRFLGIGGGGGRSPRSSPRSSPKAKLKFLLTDSSPRPSPSASAAAARAAEITAAADADRPPAPPLLPLDKAGGVTAGDDAIGSPSSTSTSSSPTRSPLAMKRSRSGSASAVTSGGSKRGLGGRSKSKKSKQKERQVELERAEAAAAMARMLMGDDEGGEQEQEVQPSNAAAAAAAAAGDNTKKGSELAPAQLGGSSGGINPAIQKLYDDGVISQSEYDHMVEADRMAAREHLLDYEDMLGERTSEVVGDEGDASDAQQKQTRIDDDGTDTTTTGDDNDAVGSRDEQSEPGADLDDTHGDGDLPVDAKDISYYTAIDDTVLEEEGDAVEEANDPPLAGAEISGDYYLDLSEITATSEVSAKQEEQQKLNVSDLLQSIDENDVHKGESEDAAMAKPEIVPPPISTEGDLDASNVGEEYHHPITPAASLSMAPPATLSKAPHGSLTKDSRRNSVGDELLIGLGGVGGDTSSDSESDQITHDVQPNQEADNDAEDDEDGDGELLVGFGLRRSASERTVDDGDKDQTLASATIQSEGENRDNEGGADKDDSLLEMLGSAMRDGTRPSGVAPTVPADINLSKGAESCVGEGREETEMAPHSGIGDSFVEQMESVWNQTSLMPAGGAAATETIEDGFQNTGGVGKELTTPPGSPAVGNSPSPGVAVKSDEIGPSTEDGEENSVECPLTASPLEPSSGVTNIPSLEGSPIAPAPISPASFPVEGDVSRGPVPDRMPFPMLDDGSQVDEKKPSVMSCVEDTNGGLLPSREKAEGRPPPQAASSDDGIYEERDNLSSTETVKKQKSTGVDQKDSSQKNEIGDEEIDQQDAESSSSIHSDHAEAEEKLLNRSELQIESPSSIDVANVGASDLKNGGLSLPPPGVSGENSARSAHVEDSAGLSPPSSNNDIDKDVVSSLAQIEVPSDNFAPCEPRETQQPIHSDEVQTETSAALLSDEFETEASAAFTDRVESKPPPHVETSPLSLTPSHDPRSAMLAAISARRQPEDDEGYESELLVPSDVNEDAATRILLEPVLSTERQPGREDTEEGENEIMELPSTLLVSAPNSGIDDSEAPSPPEQPEKYELESPSGADDATSTENTFVPESSSLPSPILDNRDAMLAAITARRQIDDDSAGSEDEAGPTLDQEEKMNQLESESAMDPHSAMLAAITARREPDEEGEENKIDVASSIAPVDAVEETEEAETELPSATDPSFVMTATVSGQEAHEKANTTIESSPKTDDILRPESVSALDPRADAKGEDGNNGNAAAVSAKVEDLAPATKLDPRATMLSAIAAQEQPDDDEDKVEAAAEDSPVVQESSVEIAQSVPLPAIDPRAAMLSAIAARKKPDEEDGVEVDTAKGEPASKPASASAMDPRAAMLSAIAARKKSEDEGNSAVDDTAEFASALKPSPTLDPQAAMLSAIAAPNEPDDDEETSSSSLRDFLHDMGIAMHLVKTGGEDTVLKYKDAGSCNIPLSLRFAASVFFHQMISRCKHASVSRLFASENVGSFLTFLGPEPSCLNLNDNSPPLHLWERGSCIRSEIQGKACVDAKQILIAARANLKGFEKVIDRIVTFARRSEGLARKASSTLSTQSASSQITYSIGIKAEASIVDKSARKYGGDVARVKDVLRSQIVLPDEASIVSTLLCLQHICSPQTEKSKMKIIRIKNLFRLSPLGTIVPTDLPSGYRHVLINVRMEDGLVAEIQLNLERMYNILGADGYQLHRHIVEIEKARRENVPSASEPAMQKDESSSNSNTLLLCRCAETIGVSDEDSSMVAIIKKLHWHKSNPQDEGTHRGDTCTVPPFPDPIARGSDLQSPKNSSFLRSHLTLPDDRFGFLEKLESDLNSSQPQDLINAAMSSGLSYLKAFPRDSSAFMCLHKLFMTRAASTGSDSDIFHAEQALHEGISAVDGAAIEHGAVVDPSISMQMLSAVAMFHCQVQKDWERASSVFQSLILRIKDHVPAHHPILLACNIDLAACYLHCGHKELSSKCCKRAKQSLDIFLRQLEEVYFMSGQCRAEAISAMKALVATLFLLKRRRMTKFLGEAHPMSLFFQCCIGDAFSVLANCVGSSTNFASNSICGCCGEASDGSSVFLTNSAKSLWEIGAHTYRTALQGWVRISGTDHPNVASTASALARCLRELGRREEAIRVLSLVTDAAKLVEAPNKDESIEAHPKVSPREIHWMKSEETVRKRKEEQLAISLWLLGVYETESIDGVEERRERAIHLLRDIINLFPLQSDDFDGKVVSSEIEQLLTAVPLPTDKLPSNLRMAMLSTLARGNDGDAVKPSLVQASVGLEKVTKVVNAQAVTVGASKPKEMNGDAGDERQLAENAEERSPMPDSRMVILSAISTRKDSKEDIISAVISASTDETKTSAPARKAPNKENEESFKRTEAGGLDPRAAMLSAITARKQGQSDDQTSTETLPLEETFAVGSTLAPATTPAPATLDPREAMLSAIAARKKPDDDSNEAEISPHIVKREKPTSSALDPRATMLAAISSRKKVDEGKEISDSSAVAAPEPKPAPTPAFDPRAAMLSAIAARKQPNDDEEDRNTDTPAETESPPAQAPAAALDPRAAMLSAIAARQKPDEDDEDGNTATPDVTESLSAPLPTPELDPRAAMLSAITARKKSYDDEDKDKEEVKEDSSGAAPSAAKAPSAPTRALDPRAAMLSAIAARKKADEEDDFEVDTATAEPVAALDPRAAMLAAISSRKKPDDDSIDDDKEASAEASSLVADLPPAPAPIPALDPRAAMLSAIAARKTSDDEEEEEESAEKDNEEEQPAAPLDSRAALLASIKARKKG